jgi:hypothetical protein
MRPGGIRTVTSEEVLFREVRYFKRGAVAQWFAFLALCCFIGALVIDFYRPAVLVVGALLFVPFLLRFHTRIDGQRVRMEVWPLWRRTIEVVDVVATEVTIWDGQVGFFGGYSSRNSLAGALMSSWEGDRSVGNRAVIVTLRDGKDLQVGTFQPRAFIAALEQASGRTLHERSE